jgi:branched-chain amino acid transport system substrate-binding protein
MSKKFKWGLLGAWGLVLLSFSAGLTQETIKIGVYLPMTGGVASFGQMEWAGMQTAQAMKPRVLGKKVELFLVDTKSDKIEAANAASRLIENNKVAAILGEAISGNTLAGGPLAEKARIPMVSPTATNPLVTQGKKYVFRVCFLDTFQGEAAAKFAYRHFKARRAAVLTDKSQDYCVGLAEFFKKAFTRLGGKIVAETFCQSGDQDFSAQLSTITAAKPDVLFIPNYYTEDALIARQARELGLNLPIFGSDGAQTPELIQIGGAAVEGMHFIGHFHLQGASTPLAKEFIAQFRKKFPKEKDITAFHALGADAYFVLLDAMERAKTTDGEKVRQALAQTKKFPAVSGVMDIGPDGNAVKPAVILTVKNGEFVYLTTLSP